MRRPSIILGFVRAFLVGILVLVVAIGLTLRDAKAQLHESLIAFGDQLSSWSNGNLDSKVGHLSINGVLVHKVTASTPLGINDAFDRLEPICTEHGGLEAPESLLKSASSNVTASMLRGVYREQGQTEGVLACIDTGRPLSVGELMRRLDAFVKTGDLSAFGQLRYVMARRDGSATSLLVLWTDGSMPLLKMFPQTGDAPGHDVPGVPRPGGSQRLLSTSYQGLPYTVTVYRSPKGGTSSLVEWYAKTLGKDGWRVVPAKDGALVARRGKRTLVIRGSTSAELATTSIIELS
jgi:hypothetical protein